MEQQRLYDGAGPWFTYKDVCPDSVVQTGEDFIKPSVFKPCLEAILSQNPTLDALSLNELDGHEPKLEVVRKWLKAGGLTADNAKSIIDSLKEQLFSALKANQIEEKYYEFLIALASRLSS